MKYHVCDRLTVKEVIEKTTVVVGDRLLLVPGIKHL